MWPGAIYCCLLANYISDPNINMYSLFALWISTFLQNFITLCCLVFELRDLKEKKMNKSLS